MAHFDTGEEILVEHLRRCGELFPTQTDADLSNADRLLSAKLDLNQAYWNVIAAKPWRWARKDPAKQFVSIAKQAVTASSLVAATGVITLSATIAATQAGRKFYLDQDAIPHRIDSHTAGTAVLNLAAGAYTGAATSGAGTIFMDEITVATDILAFPIIKQLHTGDELLVIPEAEFIDKLGKNVDDRERAQYAAFITESKIRIGPHTTEARLFECSYNRRPDPLTFDGAASTDTPIVPREGRVIIGLFALRTLLIDKRDERYKVIQGEIDEKWALLSGTELSFAKPRTYVRRGANVNLGR